MGIYYDRSAPSVVLDERATRGRRDRIVGVRLPGDLSVELADVLVLDNGRRGEGDRDAPDGVVGRGENERVVGGPVLQRVDAAGDVDVLPEDGGRLDVERDGDRAAATTAVPATRCSQTSRAPAGVRLAGTRGERRESGGVAPGEVGRGKL